ncbi:MAG: multiprotein bridging factor aMBF1 [Nitrososphaeria archaeon]
MNCEICGKRIEGKGKKVLIEGSILNVCTSCALLGDKEVSNKTIYNKKKIKVVTPVIRRSMEEDEIEIVQDFATLIKQAREKMGLSQDALAKKINEKVSVIKLIETGKLKPSILLGKKIERALKINLFTKVEKY